MSRRSERALLVALAVSGLFPGLWALLAPSSFHASFPGLGRAWVAPDGPYNEHLVRDVGALFVALAAVAVVALVTASRGAVLAAGVAWLVAGVPHLLYHVTHLDGFSALDAVLQTISLVVAPLAALVLLTARPARERAKIGG